MGGGGRDFQFGTRSVLGNNSLTLPKSEFVVHDKIQIFMSMKFGSSLCSFLLLDQNCFGNVCANDP